MGQLTAPIDQATRQARQAARPARRWIEWLGRAGYGAKGVVYIIIGSLAAQVALGTGGEITDSRGALHHLIGAPFGRLLLDVVAIGLLGYAIWRLVQAALDPERRGADPQGLWIRGTYLVIGLFHAGLALSAFQLILDSSSAASGESSTRDRTAWLLSQPFGQWLTAAVGAGIVGSGLFQLYRAWQANFRDDLHLGQLSPEQELWITRLGRLGFAARGVSFSLIGLFLILAAVHAQPAEARGLSGALTTLGEQPSGPWLLGLTAAGLTAYGLFMLIEARYRRMVLV